MGRCGRCDTNSLIAAGLPLITALVGLGVSTTAITAVSAIFDLNSSTSALASMLGIAVGIDYALFIVSRYRSERADGYDAKEAAARANGTAGSAVVFAGVTVVIALAGLAVVNLPMLTAMGLAAAGAVVVSVLVAVTLVPALLGFAGERVLGKARKKSARTPAPAAAPRAHTSCTQEFPSATPGSDPSATGSIRMRSRRKVRHRRRTTAVRPTPLDGPAGRSRTIAGTTG